MRIIFLRHAEAEPAGEGGDAPRQLTKKGRKHARAAGKAIAALGEKVRLVLSSPLPRALETAERAAKAFRKADVEPLDALGTAFSRKDVHARLAAAQDAGVECVCLVGHAPDLGDCAAGLIGLSNGRTLDLEKAGAACVVLAHRPRTGAGQLAWMLGRKPLLTLAR